MAYDVIVVGGGPAGLTAALYTARSGWKVIVLDPMGGGGQAATTDMIHNYPGFPQGIKGPELMELMTEHARGFGAVIEMDEVKRVTLGDRGVFSVSGQASTYESSAVIYCAGTSPRRLNVPGEDRLVGKGVSFCATCDGPLFSGRRVAVVGGGDSALTEAQFLARLASQVILIHRRNEFRAGLYNQKMVRENGKIVLRMNSVVDEIHGERYVEGITVRNVKTGEVEKEPVSAVFVYAGSSPNSAPVADLVETDDSGYIVTGPDMSTKTPGLYAAGDVRRKSLRQVSTAVGDGATAAFAAETYLMGRTI
ncbi:MAG TPA: thioredoxin-disulfide reductase [Firmicutes bacterium]|nr:thioredoxin-disulfide reductase [Candidatus Fermentithermobacillaceae bacterium]